MIEWKKTKCLVFVVTYRCQNIINVFDIVKNIPSVLNLAKVKIVFPSILNISNRYELHKLSIKNFLTFNSMGEGDNRVITSDGTTNAAVAESNLTFDGTNLNSPYFQSTNSVGAEGGQINLALAQTTGLTSSYVNIDIYADKLRIFEDGGNNRGVYIDLSKAPNTVGGELLTKASGLVNAGVDVTLGNLKARIPTSGNRSLQISTVTGTYSVYGSGIYNQTGSIAGITIQSGSPLSVTTTPVYLNASAGFSYYGSIDTWVIMDTGQSISWRITMIMGANFNNNMISIERLV